MHVLVCMHYVSVRCDFLYVCVYVCVCVYVYVYACACMCVCARLWRGGGVMSR